MPKKSEPTARLRFVSSKLTNSTQPVIVLHWHLHNHWNKCTHEPPDFKRFTLFCVMHFAGSVTAQPYASYYSCSKSKRGNQILTFSSPTVRFLIFMSSGWHCSFAISGSSHFLLPRTYVVQTRKKCRPETLLWIFPHKKWAISLLSLGMQANFQGLFCKMNTYSQAMVCHLTRQTDQHSLAHFSNKPLLCI